MADRRGRARSVRRTFHFRVVFLPQPAVLAEAYDRLERFVKRWA